MTPLMTLSQQGVIHGLGYRVVEAQAALASFPRDPPLPLEECLRQALACFARP